MELKLKESLDALAKQVADSKKVKQAFVSGIINAQMLAVKIIVFGQQVNDKRLDAVQTSKNMNNDLIALCFNFGEALEIPVEDVGEVILEVTKGIEPLIELYYGSALKRI